MALDPTQVELVARAMARIDGVDPNEVYQDFLVVGGERAKTSRSQVRWCDYEVGARRALTNHLALKAAGIIL